MLCYVIYWLYDGNLLCIQQSKFYSFLERQFNKTQELNKNIMIDLFLNNNFKSN